MHKHRSIIIITNSLYEANILYDSVANYTEDVLLFPMDDFITSKIATISPELKTIRLATINTLLNNNNKIIITHLMGYLKLIQSKDENTNFLLNLKIGSTYNREELIKSLYNLGYINESITTKTGEFFILRRRETGRSPFKISVSMVE